MKKKYRFTFILIVILLVTIVLSEEIGIKEYGTKEYGLRLYGMEEIIIPPIIIPSPVPLALAETVSNTNSILLHTLFVFVNLVFLFLGFKYEQGTITFLSCLIGILISISFIKFVTLNILFQNLVIIFMFFNLVIILILGINGTNKFSTTS